MYCSSLIPRVHYSKQLLLHFLLNPLHLILTTSLGVHHLIINIKLNEVILTVLMPSSADKNAVRELHENIIQNFPPNK